MAEREQYPHILVTDATTTEQYRYPGGGGARKKLPSRDRVSHAKQLLGNLDQARNDAEKRKDEVKVWAVRAKKGVHLEFESEPGFGLELESLDHRSPKDIQLVAVRESPDSEAQLATVYVPEGKLESLEKKIRRYETENTAKGAPRHQKMVEKIAHIRHAKLRSFWTDRENLFPAKDETIWWEVWLRSREEKMLHAFRKAVNGLGIEVGERSLVFPGTRVLLVYGSLEQLSDSVEVVDSIAELRRAKEVPSIFMEMPRLEMGQRVEDLLRRIPPPPDHVPAICVLDTGVNVGHPLLRVAAEPSDAHAVDPGWRVDDHDGHGTGMAGLALYGDLTEVMAKAQPIELPARLESVKILPPPPQDNDPDLYGKLTNEAVYRVEVDRPNRNRVQLMAVTATDGREQGRPSSWSAAVDQLAYGGEGEPQRLWILAAGNSDKEAWGDHPEHLETDEIHDPGQAWNALTVGALTDRWQIEERDFEAWKPVARPGELSPSTTTSMTWKTYWPLKPDVVCEGGNAARSPSGEIDQPDSLSLLTTHYRPAERLLSTFGETSAASALVARTGAFLQDRYPDLWPETIRALIVHSASWTEAMLKRYGPLPALRKNKRLVECLIRRCGFGVPNLERALWSAGNRLTLIAQEEFQPFIREKKEGRWSTRLKELQIYELPWPKEQLQELGELEVKLRVTLSYFIEPNPSERGYQHRHRYPSHGFRFEIRPATERLEDFRKRLNKAARDEGEGSPGTSDPTGWSLGSDRRHRGSLHSDLWTGTAAALANREHVAVYPIVGWWKERHKLGRWRQKARYALVVSIQTPEINVDLYTPVRNIVSIPIETG